MTTTISIPTSEYNRAQAFAKERNLSIDELFIVLLGQYVTNEDDTIWNNLQEEEAPYTQEELMARIDEGEAQFERGEFKTHEQMMQELREEFSWLK